jgi:hypothetical protein
MWSFGSHGMNRGHFRLQLSTLGVDPRGPHPLDPPAVFGDEAQVDGGHGRIETRRVWSTEALGGVVSGERGPGLTRLVMVDSIRQLGAKERVAQRYSLSSLPGATDDRPASVGPRGVRLWHHRCDTDTRSMRLPVLSGHRHLFNRNICCG